MSDLEQLLAEIAEHQAKLNELYAQRRALIQQMAAMPDPVTGKRPHLRDLARIFGVTPATISHAVHWGQKHLERAQKHLKIAEYWERQGEERQAKYWRDVAENLLESGSPK